MPVTTEITQRMRYDDTDSYGIAYFGCYFRFIEAARTELLREYLKKTPKDYEKEGLGFPFVNVNINYRKPSMVDDLLTIRAELTEIGNTSMKMKFTVKRRDDVLVDIDSTMVCLKDRKKPVKVPDEIRKLL